MTARSISAMLPVKSIEQATNLFGALLGVRPDFVDGEQWAQFTIGENRLALAGKDRASDSAGIMVKLDDLEAGREVARSFGLVVGEVQQGSHEMRCLATSAEGWCLVLYAPR